MIIVCKSTPENFKKEKSGVKPNTVRQLDGHDYIIIENTETGDTFQREIQDITTHRDNVILSFNPLGDVEDEH